MAEERRLVWDLPLRIFHWLLVASIVASYVTAKIGFETMQYHMYLGYWTLGSSCSVSSGDSWGRNTHGFPASSPGRRASGVMRKGWRRAP